MDIMSLVISLVAGAIAGNIISAAMKQDSINFALRTLLGAVGGIIGNVFFLSITGGDAMSGALVDIYTGVFGGAILTAVAGAVIPQAFNGKR